MKTSTIAAGTLVALLGGALVCGSAHAGVFRFSGDIGDYHIPTSFFAFDLSLPKYSGPGDVTKVTLAIKGESGGVIGNIPIISPPFEFPPTLAFWENSLVAVDNPHIVGPTVELSATSAGFSCDTSCPPEFDTPLGPLPFAAEAVQSDLSDFKGAGSNAFVLVVSGPAEFSDIFGNATVTETILTTVPEPSTWAMMLLGFAGLGFAGYRTSRNRAALAA